MWFESFAAKALAALVAAFLLLAGGFYFGHHVEYLAYQAYVAKITANSAKALADAELHNKTLSDAADEQQRQITKTYQEKLNEISKQRDDALAMASDGMWVRTTGCRAVPDPATATAPSHERDYAELQLEDARALIDLAADANECVIQLEAAQKVIIEDRVIINGAYPSTAKKQPNGSP